MRKSEPDDELPQEPEEGLPPEVPDRLERFDPLSSDGTAPEPRGYPPARRPEYPGYVIEEWLDGGGMGHVYQARQEGSNWPVALKEPKELDADTRHRFKREFRALQGVTHRNLVVLDELGEHD